LDPGSAGASARREHRRRKSNREARVRSKHPVIGGMLLALGEEPPHDKAWDRGGSGEEHVAQELAKHLSQDRRRPARQARRARQAGRTSTTSPSRRPACGSSTPSATAAS
jgi:hypothetical protein